MKAADDDRTKTAQSASERAGCGTDLGGVRDRLATCATRRVGGRYVVIAIILLCLAGAIGLIGVFGGAVLLMYAVARNVEFVPASVTIPGSQVAASREMSDLVEWSGVAKDLQILAIENEPNGEYKRWLVRIPAIVARSHTSGWDVKPIAGREGVFSWAAHINPVVRDESVREYCWNTSTGSCCATAVECDSEWLVDVLWTRIHAKNLASPPIQDPPAVEQRHEPPR